MKLSELKNSLEGLEIVKFQLPNGQLIESHFHVTEVGKVTKHFIDCGGVIRKEEVVNFQLWEEKDYDHRLHPEKLLSIIELSEKMFKFEDLEIEVEYQGATIGKYGLDFNSDQSVFMLTEKQTDCLAKDNCGIPETKEKVELSALVNSDAACTPGGGCC